MRRTLLLSLAALMGLALVAVGVALDRLAANALAAREESADRFIDQHAAELVRQERERFDADLGSLATKLANEVQMQYYAQHNKDFEKYFNTMRLTPIGALGAGLAPWPIGVPVWQTLPFNRRANETLARKYFSELHLEDKPFVDDENSPELVLVTVQSTPDKVYRSKTMENESWEIPPFDSAKLIDEKYETVQSKHGPVRVATLKSPINFALRYPRSRSAILPGPPRPPMSPPQRTEAPLAPPEPQQVPYRTAFIQCGRSTAPLDAKIEAIELRRDAEKVEEKSRTARDRQGLRAWLGLIGVLAFGVLIGGGMLLVQRGLKPLDTLSEAVGKVSQKDFRLSIETNALSKELVPIHAKLTQTLDLLKKAFEHDKQAVADISHELRTPVAALLATLDVSLRKPRDAEHYKQTLTECRGITKQLQGLVERVMTLASLDATPAATLKSDVDAVELAEGVASVIRPLAESHGLSLTVEAPQPVRVTTDPDKLREVLLNLLHNAVEYNRPGGRVTLNVSNGGPNAVLSVTDSGIGMTPDVQSRIFERFYRADPSRTQTGIHAGLGLAIVKECVDRLGGNIRVLSAPGAGSEFRVELPCS